MGTSTWFLTVALLLASVGNAGAQTPQGTTPAPTNQPAAAPPAESRRFTSIGSIDFGVRGTDITGDAARFQRYRDLGNGAFVERFHLGQEGDGWLLDIGADKAGRLDQRYTGEFIRLGKAKVYFEWNQIPLLISQSTASLYQQVSPGVFRIDDDIQLGLQTGQFTLQSVLDREVAFDTKNRRDIGRFGFTLTPTRNLDVTFDLTNTRREGNMPWGASYAFNFGVEVPVPIDSRTTGISTAAEWANQTGMVRVGYDGSWFDNRVETLVWDNPLKLTDSTASNAYVTGLGTSQGRMALWPDSTMHSVSALGSVKLAGRSRFTGFLALGTTTADAEIVPHTINTAIPVIPLERSTTEAEARTLTANLAFSSRPARYVRFSTRYRYSDLDKRTPIFETSEYVRFDQVIEPGPWESEPYSVRRHTFDADVTVDPIPYTAIKAGYGRYVTDRTFRIFDRTNEDVFRVSVDTTGNQYVSLRTLFEVSRRKGDGFEPHLLQEVGEQPGMRHFDVADRDRTRGTVALTVTPMASLGFTASVAAGNDDYKEGIFGLRDNDHRIYTVGVDAAPTSQVSCGLSYTRERYTALQWSRNATPGPQFTDPTRDWSIDSDDQANTVIGTLDLNRVIPNTELRLGWDYSRSTATYLYGLPPVTSLTTPQQLPPVKNELRRGTVDTRYFLTKRVAVGFVYWYDRYDVEDFALANERIDLNTLAGGYLLGYMYRPYTAHSGWFRVTVLW